METAHSRLASLARNFIAKYADDIAFDYEDYKPLDSIRVQAPILLGH